MTIDSTFPAAEASGTTRSAATPLLRATGLRKTFGDIVAVDDVSLSVARAEVVCLIGRSGSGKSTVLRCLNHLDPPDQGTVELGGEIIGYRERNGALHQVSARALARQRRQIGMVFQQFNLFPYLTALENVIEAPVGVLKNRKSDELEIARELLDKVGLAHRVDAYPGQMSGGEQQRVAIARALAQQPSLIVADEPVASLDPNAGAGVLELLRGIAQTDGVGIVCSLHQVHFARAYADRIIGLSRGRIVIDGPSNEFDQAALERLYGHRESAEQTT